MGGEENEYTLYIIIHRKKKNGTQVEERIAQNGDGEEERRIATVAEPTKTERNARGERAKSSCYK